MTYDRFTASRKTILKSRWIDRNSSQPIESMLQQYCRIRHEKEQDDDRDARGLSYEQKVVIHDAFSKNIQSAREIKHFFRAQRIASKKIDPEGSFPMDPPEEKLKNYIQAYKRSSL